MNYVEQNGMNSEPIEESSHIDKNIIGRWEGSWGEYFEFGEDGRFNSNIHGYGLYTASQGELALNPDSDSHSSADLFLYLFEDDNIYISYLISSVAEGGNLYKDNALYVLIKEE